MVGGAPAALHINVPYEHDVLAGKAVAGAVHARAERLRLGYRYRVARGFGQPDKVGDAQAAERVQPQQYLLDALAVGLAVGLDAQHALPIGQQAACLLHQRAVQRLFRAALDVVQHPCVHFRLAADGGGVARVGHGRQQP